MKNLPSDFQNWLQSRSGNLTITPVDGYIQAVTFHQLVDIISLPLYVSIDEYIENYSEKSEHLAGNYYPVSAYDLLKDVSGYSPVGALVWIPLIGEFATYDNDHCVLRSFPMVTWQDIIKSMAQFIDCQWYPDRVENKLVRPWDDARFSSVIPTKEPW